MASARVVQGKSVTGTEAEKPSRREFLYYVWGASLALALGGTAAGVTWYMLPRPKPGDIITVSPEDVPLRGSLTSFPEGKFHLIHTDTDEVWLRELGKTI